MIDKNNRSEPNFEVWHWFDGSPVLLCTFASLSAAEKFRDELVRACRRGVIHSETVDVDAVRCGLASDLRFLRASAADGVSASELLVRTSLDDASAAATILDRGVDGPRTAYVERIEGRFLDNATAGLASWVASKTAIESRLLEFVRDLRGDVAGVAAAIYGVRFDLLFDTKSDLGDLVELERWIRERVEFGLARGADLEEILLDLDARDESRSDDDRRASAVRLDRKIFARNPAFLFRSTSND